MITQLRWIKKIREKNILIKYEDLPINSSIVGVSCALHFTHCVVQMLQFYQQLFRHFRENVLKFTGRVERLILLESNIKLF